ncbi:hypothetical protein LTR05_006117 [Lithohypha guttulata]|uniref:3-dehydrosphinganine reductase n=1 Tax=Lithohypha guttulata TaxID=1690604 RepID=A0AAN7YEQ7_9EURO|nr:hypothetical protein LTR05_006117 [Lithohypha guttulata]
MLLVVFSAVIAAIAGLAVMGFLTSRKQFEVVERTVIITGGSQGLGLELAKQLSAKGANIVIVAQTVSKLEHALESIRNAAVRPAAQRFMYLSYDLRSPDSASSILSKVTQWNDGIPADIVINCAGHCIPGFFASCTAETLRDQMDTLYWSCAYMAHSTLQQWTKPVDKQTQKSYDNKPRHLIFTSSVLAFMPLAGYAAYNPAKAAMRALADTLNQEVQVYNGTRLHPTEAGPAAEIKIHAIYPGGIKTPGFENEMKLKPALTNKLEEDDKPQQPDDLARIIIAELEAGRYMITSSFVSNVMKGWAMGGSQRTGLADYFWNGLGSLIVLFIAPDFMSKCRKWGKQKGLQAAI